MSMTPRASADTVLADGSRRDILVGIARGALAGAVVAIGSDVAAQPSPAPLPRVTEAVTPFRVVRSGAAISEARRRLQATRWPERQTADDWRQGAPLATVKSLVAYWRTAYDWRRLERRLNAYPQFRTEIDGLGIHFLHVRSPHEHARPIILTHGWPGSIVEFLNVIGPLTNPTKHGGQPEDAFHVVLPSLPGSERAMPDTIETLIKRNLHEVFGERDGKKRREAIAQLWTEDCVFIDHGGKRHGRDELDSAVAALHQRLPSYVFSELRPVDLLHESGRLAWSYGRPGQEPIKGVDVVLVRDGRISLMLTFLDEVPAQL
jgi:Epoxide hydrolase N terminus/SnoaL-like domain